MRKILLSAALLLAVFARAENENRARFLFNYYSGDYNKAHSLIAEVFSDAITRQIWEERIHLQSGNKECNFLKKSDDPARAMALIRIGAMKRAEEFLRDDWLSLLGKAQIAIWENRRPDAEKLVKQALALAPERPETLFFAGNIAPNIPESIAHFEKLLKVIEDDPYRKQLIEYSIAFMNKTRDMQLNIASQVAGFEKIDTQNKKGKLIIKTDIDGLKDVQLLVDTGAGGLTLEKKQWEPQIMSDLLIFGIGKQPVTKGTRVVLSEFKAGAFNMTNPVAAIADHLPGDSIDGIIGTAFFSNHLILVPMKSGNKFSLFQHSSEAPVEFLRDNGIEFSESFKFPFYLVNKMMIVKGRIRNSPEELDMMIDTGAERTMLSASAAKQYARVNYALSNEANKNSTLTGVGGKAENLLVVENVNVQIGSIQKEFNRLLAINLAEGSEAMELELDCILGRDFLADYTLLIDYRNNQVTFLR